jgi:uncharacterized protein (TIGR02246 family)
VATIPTFAAYTTSKRRVAHAQCRQDAAGPHPAPDGQRKIEERGRPRVRDNAATEYAVHRRSTYVTDQQADIRAVLDAYAAAVYAKDVDAFVAIYDDDVHVFDAWGEFESRGIDAMRAMAAGWFGSLGDERVPVEYDDVAIAVSGDVAFAHATVTFVGESATGERLRATTNRFTFCLAKRDGAWKIVHEHASLPIDMASMTAIVAR